MKLKLIQVGKTDEHYLIEGIEEYKKRLSKFLKFEEITVKNNIIASRQGIEIQKNSEGRSILKNISDGDYLILLDEKGRSFTSRDFSKEMEKLFREALKSIIFCIGGPYGFSDEVYKRANDKVSFSAFTFSHQMIRLFFWEQIYRTQTITNRHKYHND